MTLNEAITGISHHRERIHTNNLWTDPVALSDVGLKLITYNSYLADELADLHKIASDKHHAVYLDCINKGEGVTKAEQMAKGESTTERKEYEKAKFIYTATGSLISFIQTKIRVSENQMKQEVSNG